MEYNPMVVLFQCLLKQLREQVPGAKVRNPEDRGPEIRRQGQKGS